MEHSTETGLNRLVRRLPPWLQFRLGLGFKLLFIVVVVSLIGVFISSLLVESLQRHQLIELAKSTSSQASDVIAVSLEHSMPVQGQMFNQIIRSLVGEGLVRRIKVLDPQGVVRASSDANEVGMVLDRQAALCQECHAPGGPPRNETLMTTLQNGDPILLTVTPIHNQPECEGCHPASVQVLGVSMVEAPLTDLNNQVAASVNRIILAGAATFVLMVSLLMLGLHVLVTRPIGELAKGIMNVGRGNLDQPVHARGNDELADLAESFNWMRQQLQWARAETAERNRELTVLYQVGTQVSGSLELAHVLDAVTDGARRLLVADIGWVGLCHPEQSCVSIQSYSGTRSAVLKGMRIPISMDLGKNGSVLNAPDLGSLATFEGARVLAEREGIVSMLGVPLQRGERILGMAGVMTRTHRRFTPTDEQLLSRLAGHVTVALENARLYDQVHGLAILEERDRLAREMHDELSQALGYLNLKTCLTAEQLAQGNVPDAQRGLTEMSRILEETYTGIREAIFNLRTTIPIRTGLDALVRGYLADYQTHFGIRIQFLNDGENPAAFSEDVTVQVLRIVQEALTNIRKHSGAKNVTVRFGGEEGLGRITIQDDGRGFDRSAITAKEGQAFGLDIMRERARGIGGDLEIDSQPGHGTRIVIRLPQAPSA